MPVPSSKTRQDEGRHTTRTRTRLHIILRDLLSNMPVLLHNNLVATLGCLDRVWLLVEVLEFLERTTLGFDTDIISKLKSHPVYMVEVYWSGHTRRNTRTQIR